MLKRLKKQLHPDTYPLRSYRSGYLPSQRRSIEEGLRSGHIRGVTATNALELGVDIGSLDAAVLAGYPGTIAGAWQQAGRSGRTDKTSLSILVASSIPLDQYLAIHPDFLFGNNPECGYIDANNLLISLNHLRCAVFELPFQSGSRFGSFSFTETKELLDLAKKKNIEVIGITDHDTIDGLSEAIKYGKTIGVEVVPGLEISTDIEGQEVHLLGYYVNYKDPELRKYLTFFRKERLERAKRILRKLENIGISLNLSDVQELAQNSPICRPHIAKAMVKAGIVKDFYSAFNKYIGDTVLVLYESSSPIRKIGCSF